MRNLLYRPRAGVCACALVLSSCKRASTFNLWGSFFPAWLVCAAAGVLMTFAVHWLLRRMQIELVFPVLTYPSLTALVTFTLWLAFFQ
jgi:hypothetical protein